MVGDAVQPGTLLEGRFRIVRFVAAGGTGSVYQADDLQSGLPVAIKQFPPAKAFFSGRFARESEILQELRHPAIVSFVTQGLVPEGWPYIAMEWVEGRTLREVLQARRLTVAETVRVARRVLEALDETHRRGILHLDLKPGNLMLLEQDDLDVKVLDFGLAALTHETGRSDKVQGTPGYMSPEQARGEPLDATTDLFSLGCVLYEALTQVPAFQGVQSSATLSKIVAGDPEPLGRLRPSTPAALVHLIERLLSKHPKERPEIDEILTKLDQVGPSWVVDDEPSSDGITLDEQRITALLVARDPKGPEVRSRLHFSNLAQLGFELQVLMDGTIVGTLRNWTHPLEAAVTAVRAGLRVASLLPDARVTLGLGQVRRGANDPDAAALDEAFCRLDETPPGSVSVDESVALLSTERFEITSRGTVWVLEGERSPAEEPRPLLGRMTPLLGRDAESEALAESFRISLRERRAAFHLIVGEAGSGKSRLLRHALSEPLRKGARILKGRAEQDRFEALGLWKRLLRDDLELTSRSTVAEVERALSKLPDGARRPLLSLLVPEHSSLADPHRDDPSAIAGEVRTAIGTWIENLVCERPLVLMIDDLQYLDVASQDTLRGLLTRLSDQPLWVVAAGAPSTERRFRSSQPRILKLDPLHDEAAAELVRTSLGPSCDVPSLRRIVEQAQGNPFLLEELIRAAARGESDAVPRSVLALAQDRLESLSPGARRALRAASVFGRRFSQAGLAAILGSAGDNELEEAEAAEFIRRVQGGEWAFRHGLLREAAYQSLPASERRMAHGRAAQWLEAEVTAPKVMARHWEQAGLPLKAVPYYRRAAEAALEANDLDGAYELARQGLARGAQGKDLGALALVQAEVRAFRGELATAARWAQDALQAQPEGEPGWYRALIVQAHAAGSLGFPSLIRQAHQSMQQVPGPPTALRVAALAEVVLAFLQIGHPGEAEPVLEELRASRNENLEHDMGATAWFETALAAWASAHGDVSSALDHRSAAAEAYRTAGDVRRACLAVGEAGFARLAVGDLPGAQEMLERAFGEARQVGLPHTEAQLSCLLGALYGRAGDLAASEEALERAVRSLCAQRDVRGEGIARSYLASALRLMGRTEDALHQIQRSITLLQEFAPHLAGALAVLARLQLDRKEVGPALQSAESAMDHLARGGPIELGEMYVRLVHARVLEATGDREATQVALRRARARLLERASHLKDPALKTGYLVRVPENARILSLARRFERA